MGYVDNFKDLLRDGSRTYMFKWVPPLGLSSALFLDKEYDHLVKSMSVPEVSMNEITMHWQGIEMKMAASKRSSDWTVTFYSDGDGEMRGKFEIWQHLIHTELPFIHRYAKPIEYMSVQAFKLLDVEGKTKTTYVLMYSWPKVVGAMQMDYSTQDIATFDVTFAYTYSFSPELLGKIV